MMKYDYADVCIYKAFKMQIEWNVYLNLCLLFVEN